MDDVKPSYFRSVIGMMINPAGTLRDTLSGTRWYFSVLVSALAFGLFFAQTGLDLYKTGQKGFFAVVVLLGTGLAYGLLAIPLIAVVLWVILKTVKTDFSLPQTVASFCLSYSGALVYGILGLVFSIALGWKTSVAFGVTGVLWAIGPMMIAIRELSGGKNVLGLILSTAVSAAVLLSWSYFGNL